MLIVDMPMPKYGGCHIAVDWDGHSFVCPIKRKTCNYFFSKKRPDWCPIKGELVRCGECKYDGRCMFQSFVIDNSRDEVPYDKNTFYCVDGERKDGEHE